MLTDPPSPAHGSTHVIIIEDDPDALANLRDILELAGYQPAGFTSLKAAFQHAGWADAAFVIVDRKLSDGIATDHLPRMRTLAPGAAIAVVTGYRDLEGAVDSLRRGADDYILKPVNPDELLLSMRRLAEFQHAKQERMRLAAIVDSSTDAIVGKSLDGRIVSWNAGAERLYGYTAAEIIGQPARLLIPEGDESEAEAMQQRIIRGERVPPFETQRVRKDGTLVDVSMALSPIIDPAGRVVAAAAISRDISERKALERRVLEISVEEQQRIGRDLHDGLGQELTGLSFLADVLARELANHKADEAKLAEEVADLARTAIKHTKATVRGLCPVYLEGDGFMNAVEQLARSVTDMGDIACELVANQPLEMLDHPSAVHLYYIVSEAVNNAVKHSRARHITVRVHVGRTETEVAVEDDGRGMPQSHHTGRGLQTMTERARVLGGNIRIEPNRGGGTRVVCRFTPGKTRTKEPSHAAGQ
jgi:PAS domain S-box-containing protein